MARRPSVAQVPAEHLDADLLNESAPKFELTISVVQARNLATSKEGANPLSVSSFVKFKFGLEEEAVSDIVPDNNSPLYNVTRTYTLVKEIESINRSLNLPVVVQVCEGTPAEPIVLGTAYYDFTVFLQNKTEFTEWLTLQGAKSPGEEFIPEVQVTASVSEALLTPEEVREGNVVQLACAGIFSLPERCHTKQGEGDAYPFSYEITLEIPSYGEKPLRVALPGGAIVVPEGYAWPVEEVKTGKGAPAADAKKGGAPAKADPKAAKGAAAAVAAAPVEATPPPAESPPPPPLTEEEKREKAEREGQRVSFSLTAMAYLGREVVARFRDALAARQPCTAHIRRKVKPALAGSLNDPNASKYHGVFSVPLDELLAPGCLATTGTFTIQAFQGMEEDPSTVSLAATVAGGPRAASKAGGAPADKKGGAAPAAAKKEKATTIEKEEEDPSGLSPYQTAGTFLKLDVALLRALVPKPPPKPALRPRDIIPPRPRVKKFQAPRDAAEEFHKEIQAMVGELCDQYRRLFSPVEKLAGAPAEAEERRRKLVFELNSSGKYFAFKEKLKKSVVRVVKEKFHRQGAGEPAEMEALVSDLYVYLVEEMHRALNKTFSPKPEEGGKRGPPVPPFVGEAGLPDAILALANEAEMNGQLAAADRYHKDRIVKGNTNAGFWHDYGRFLLRAGEAGRAEEALREALALEPEHRGALLCYGALLLSQGRLDLADSFLQGAMEGDLGDPVALVLLGLLFEAAERPDDAANALDAAYAAYKERHGASSASESMEMAAAEYLLELRLAPLAEQLLLRHEAERGKSGALALARARCAAAAADWAAAAALAADASANPGNPPPPEPLRGPSPPPAAAPLSAPPPAAAAPRFPAPPPPPPAVPPSPSSSRRPLAPARRQAQGLLPVAPALTPAQAAASAAAANAIAMRARALRADAALATGRAGEALGHLESVLKVGQPREAAFWVKLGRLYQGEGKHQEARDAYFEACQLEPSCTTWLGVGLAMYCLRDFKGAEEALAEANLRNNQEPDVWGYLCCLCLQLARLNEADMALKEALKQNITDAGILRQIGDLYLQHGRWQLADAALRRSVAQGTLAAQDLHVALSGVATAAWELGNAEEAVAALQQAVGACEADLPALAPEHAEARARLRNTLISLNRVAEAARY
eukprot:tig00000802_g4271.t1